MGGPGGAALRSDGGGCVGRRGGAARPPMRRVARPTFTECKASLIAGRLERFLTSSFRRSGGVRSPSGCLGSSVAAAASITQNSAKASGGSSAGLCQKGCPHTP